MHNALPVDNLNQKQTLAVDFLRGLSAVDQAKNEREIDRAIFSVLKLIGEYTSAARVYLFYRDEKDHNLYHNTAEWRADGTKSRPEYFHDLHAEEIPYWLQCFSKKQPVIFFDLESVKETMPVEYPALKANGVFAQTSVPVFHHGVLSGFIGLDNPPKELSDLFIHQLAFISTHLSTARENLRMIRNQKLSLFEREKERQILMILSENCISVYQVDLKKDTAVILKLDGKANFRKLTPHALKKPLCYSEEIRSYYNTFVVKKTAPDFLEKFSSEALMRQLANQETVSMRYQAIPNRLGQQYFEIRATRLSKTEDSTEALIDFRYIDEIVAEERSHQRVIENALKEARQSNEIISAIGTVYHSIYRIDLRTFIFEEISSSRDLLKLTGKRGRASIRLSDEDVQKLAPEYVDPARRFFQLSTLPSRLKDKNSAVLEYQLADGRWRRTRFIVQNRSESGRADAVLCVLQDITEDKRQEHYWIETAEEAKRTSAAKSEFLSRVSHDIRTPMNVIMGFTSIALQHPNDPARMLDCLKKIRSSGENLRQLVDDVLDLSSIESGEFLIASYPVRLDELVAFYQQAIAGMAEEKGLHFSVRTHDILRNVLLTDQVRLGQIYMNLLSNAVKYTPAGGSVQMDVYEEPLKKENMVRLISVISDTGIGMSPEFMKEMYSEFSRAVDTRVNKVRGSGLGLAIVKKIVDLMGGTIDAESQPGKGTTFRITLELPYTDQTPEATSDPSLPLDLPEKPLSLLVAEDNDLSYEILIDQLEVYRIRCTRAEDGAQCVELLKRSAPGTYDAVLMDMQMPVMNGPDAAKAIRALPDPAIASVPIIALTANAYHEDVEKCIAAGMNAHLSKPIEINRLIKTVLQYLPAERCV